MSPSSPPEVARCAQQQRRRSAYLVNFAVRVLSQESEKTPCAVHSLAWQVWQAWLYLGYSLGLACLVIRRFVAIRSSFRCTFLNPGNPTMHTQDNLAD